MDVPEPGLERATQGSGRRWEPAPWAPQLSAVRLTASIRHSKPRSHHTSHRGAAFHWWGWETEGTTAKEEEEALDCASLPKGKAVNPRRKQCSWLRKGWTPMQTRTWFTGPPFLRLFLGKDTRNVRRLWSTWLQLPDTERPPRLGQETSWVHPDHTADLERRETRPDKDREDILEAMVMLYHTLGMACLLENHGRQAQFNQQKAERSKKELKELYEGGICGLQISEKDLKVAWGRASLAIQWAEPSNWHTLLLSRVTWCQIWSDHMRKLQIQRKHDQAPQHLQQAHSICVSLFMKSAPNCRGKCVSSQGLCHVWRGPAQAISAKFTCTKSGGHTHYACDLRSIGWWGFPAIKEENMGPSPPLNFPESFPLAYKKEYL